MRPVIMILGAGVMQLPAYKAAKKNNWISIGADGNPDASCRQLADYFIPVDLKDRVRLTEKASEFKEKIGLDGVFTCGTDFSTSVAWIAAELNLPGIPYKAALNCTDKIRMRSVFAENSVPSPAFVEVSEDMDISRVTKNLNYPLVVKPVDNMGGRGVIKVLSPESLEEAVKEAIRFSRTDRAIMEEFMEGPEFSLDSLIKDGELHVTGFADRHIFFPPCFIEMGHTLPTSLSEKDKKEIIRVFGLAVKALGITNGAAKGDIKLCSDGVMIGEIAARLSGGYMSGWTYPYASGVPLVEMGMKIAMAMDPGDFNEPESDSSSERAFISIPGTVKEIKYLDEAHDIDGVMDLFLRVEEGDQVIFPVNNVTKCGNVLALGKTREEALASSEAAVKRIRILLEPGSLETENYMKMPLSHGFPPSAYESQENSWCKTEGFFEFNPDFSMTYTIHPLPVPVSEDPLYSIKDWHGISIGEALTELKNEKDIVVTEGGEWTLFSRHLWFSLLRGGIQGALWFLERNEEI
ncbi:MAG: hypothetical protein B6241_06640 [Spirochaetaceae bacterium 4572_59]|nr:MAG: hypothetical protein B6241_06640 [Spirochaetaceae bacterium 4572_59]